MSALKADETLLSATVAGLAAAVVESTVTYYLKTRQQLYVRPPGAKALIINDFPKVMFRGCSAVIAGNSIKSLMRFSVYNWATKFMVDGSGENSAPQIIVAGMFTGLCESLMIVPFENIKVTMIERSGLPAGVKSKSEIVRTLTENHATHTAAPNLAPSTTAAPHTFDPKSKKKVVRPVAQAKPVLALYEVTPGVHGFFGNVRDMYYVRGPRAFVQGFMPTIFRQVANSMVRFTTYNFFKQLAYPKETDNITTAAAFGLGAASGAVQVLSTQPIDVVKSRMQTVNGIKTYGSSIMCSFRIFIEEGPTRLWAGVVPRLIKVTFSGGLIFGVYETANKLVLRAMNEKPFSWQ